MAKHSTKEASHDADEQPERAGRPVDVAMATCFPDKEYVRSLWIDAAKNAHGRYGIENIPLYLTLCGAKALDIHELIKAGIITLTESGAISEACKNRVIAVERNLSALLELQKCFPGLRIFDQDFKSLIGGNSQIRFPIGTNEQFCRARLINLDFQGELNAIVEHGGEKFPIFEWITKLGRIHLEPTPLNWQLCLTLNATIQWSPTMTSFVVGFLSENFGRVVAFRDHCRRILGDELHDQIAGRAEVNLGGLDESKRQFLLMAFVPKRVLSQMHLQGWRMTTEANLCYGGAGRAPMISWIFAFEHDPQAIATPNQVYQECLSQSLVNARRLSADGTLSHIGQA